jgi:hypothetical protein
MTYKVKLEGIGVYYFRTRGEANRKARQLNAEARRCRMAERAVVTEEYNAPSMYDTVV